MSTALVNAGRYSSAAERIRLVVRLMPRAGRDAIEGWTTDAKGNLQLKVRVPAPPKKGKANAALIALLAKRLGVAKSMVRIASGETARVKVIELTGNIIAVSAQLDGLEHLA